MPATLLACFALTACIGGSEYGELDPQSSQQNLDAENITYGDAYWAELAQEYEAFVPEPGIGAAIEATDWISTGKWGELIDWPEIAVGAANMLDGRIVTWASEVDDYFGEPDEVTQASIFDPTTGDFEDAGHTGHNMFCAGISMLPDGRIFMAGGGLTVSTVSIFEEDEFVETDSMSMARWYPTSTTLPSGQVLTSLGTDASPYPELWTEDHGWQVMGNAPMASSLEHSHYYKDWFPALNVAPDGSLFHPGPNNELFSINLEDDMAINSHGPRTVGEKDRLYNTTVMYDVGKMLIAGGGQLDAKKSALTIDLNGATPVVTDTNSMQHARSMQNSVVLPDGTVLVIGGNSSGKQFSDNGTVLTPELWNPESGQWTELAPHKEPRNYHSTALLLRDGRVISMGGGLCGQCKSNHQNGEIFEPPYLFKANGTKAPRPVINAGPADAVAGDVIALQGSNDIVEFNMLRLVAVTHHHATDQRLVPASFVKSGAGNYQLQMNDNPNVLVPGYYWIFGINANGVPTVGHQIQVKVSVDPVAEPVSTQNNVKYSYYQGKWTKIPNFDALTPVSTGTQSDFSLNNRKRNSYYGMVFTGEIKVPKSGVYSFYLSSDDGSRLTIDDNVVINYDGMHLFEAEKKGNVFLSAGQHEIKLEYFEHTYTDALLLSWSGPNMEKRPVSRFDLGSAVIVGGGNTNPSVAPVEEHVHYRYYQGNWNVLPTFSNLQPVKSGTLPNISLAPKSQDNFYAFKFDVRISVVNAGAYTFYTRSDDGSKLYVDDQLVVNNDGLHALVEKNGVVTLAAGEHDISVEFFEKKGGDKLEVLWSGPGVIKQYLGEGAFVAPNTETVVPDGQSAATDPDAGGGTPVDPADNIGFSVASSWNLESYLGDWTNLPDFDSLTADNTTTSTVIDLSVAPRNNKYALRFTGTIEVGTAGLYTFYSKSDDGSRILVNGQSVVDNDGRHAMIEKQGGVTAVQAT